MIIKSYKKLFFTFIVPRFYGGGGAPNQNTTVQQRNIPKELAPYYEVLLNSMMKQGFTSKDNPGNPAPKATSYQPRYSSGLAEGGEVKGYAKGGEVKHYLVGGVTESTLKNIGVLDNITGGVNSKFSPTGITQYSPYGAIAEGGKFVSDPTRTAGPGGEVDFGQYVAQPTLLQNMSYKSAAGMGLPEQNAAASNLSSIVAQGGLNTANSGLEYGGAGYTAGLNSAKLGNTAADTAAANATTLGDSAQTYGALGATMGAAGANAGQAYENKATNAGTVQSYMNPYLDASLKPQLALMDQQNAIANQKSNSQAAQAGAYGGSRQTVANNLNDQSNQLAQANLIGQGYKSAYDTAQGNILQGSQLGLQGVNTGIQGAQTGLQGVTTATGAGQYGLAGAQTGLSGQAQAMQGAGVGLSGVGAAQSGYGLTGNAAQQLMGIGNQELAQQQSIAGLQNQYGQQQQALDQQGINNAISYNDYQQKYPWEILGNIGNALNGVQVGNMSQFTPAPSLISQVGGLGATALGAYGANGGFKAKKGGVIKEPKAKSGGIGDLAVYNAMKGGK
jgi:hypothetical protein